MICRSGQKRPLIRHLSQDLTIGRRNQPQEDLREELSGQREQQCKDPEAPF